MRESLRTGFRQFEIYLTRKCIKSDEAAASLLTLDVDRTGNEAIVRFYRKLVAGMNDMLFAKVSQLIPDTKRIVLDLTDLSYMDSMGLGTVCVIRFGQVGRSRFESHQPW